MENYLLRDHPALSDTIPIIADFYHGYRPNMMHFHMHSHYEISLILNGDVTVLLSNRIQTGTEPRVVLHRPYTPHHIIPEPHQLYRRINVAFTEKFAAKLPSEWTQLYSVFSPDRAILLPNTAMCERLEQILTLLIEERDLDRCRYLLFYCLSLIRDFRGTPDVATHIPDYILGALHYIGEHYYEKVTADMLARRLGIGRTMLMTKFRQYVGMPLHQYQQSLKVREALNLMEKGYSVSDAAEACGFCDIGGFVRAHRKIYGTTPTGRK